MVSKATPAITRFAPSPTGRLHRGHALSARAGHRLARQTGGHFLLRIEDIDAARCRPEHVDGIIEDLTWLGLSWDGPVLFQSTRLSAHEAALSQLRARGLLYPCFCTRSDIAAEIARSGHAPHDDQGVIYPGLCKHLSPHQRTQRLARDPHAWRLDMAAAIAIVQGQGSAMIWHDLAAGPQVADPASFGDVVLARKDGQPAYHLAVVLDDAAQGISHVTRGMDLFAATHVHRLLQALLDLPAPLYFHHPLITDAAGRRLAKRDHAQSLCDLRAKGVQSQEIIAELDDILDKSGVYPLHSAL